MKKYTNTLLKRLIVEDEIKNILRKSSKKKKNSIRAGDAFEYDPNILSNIFSTLTQRIDKLISYDLEINNGSLSKYGQLALVQRGMTLPEFRCLFSKFIEDSSEYIHYPVFQVLKLRGKPIETEKAREEVLSRYSEGNVEENYIKALYESGYESHCEFFFEWMKYSVWIPLSKIRQHIHIVGATGSGKTWLLIFLASRLINRFKKFGLILVDVHGDISQKLKRDRAFINEPDRLVYIEPYKFDGYSPTFNFFEFGNNSNKDKAHLVENLIEAFENSLERDEKRGEIQVGYLEKLIYFLIERGNSSLQDLEDLLNVKSEIFEEAKAYNPNFFNAKYAKDTNRTRTALRDRVERMKTNPALNNFFCGQSSFDFEKAINSNKVVIFNFGGLPSISAKIAGKFVIGYLKAVIRKRKKGEYKGLNFLMMDEAQVLVKGNDAFNVILSELRGFALSVILAHQFSNQLGDQKETVRQNTSVKIVGGFDEPDDIKAVITVPPNTPPLKDYQFYLKVRHRKVRIFSTPKKFISKRHKYEMTSEQEKEIDLQQKRKYYKVIGQSEQETRYELKEERKKAISDAPIPPFQIILNSEHDDKTIL